MSRNLWVGVWDLHYPFIHKPTVDAIFEFVVKNNDKIAGFYFGGDQFDNQEISHHTAGRPLLRAPGSFKKNTEGFNKILKGLEAILPEEAAKVWQIGNHDQWEQDLVEHQPELQGTIERPVLLGLDQRGWLVQSCGDHFTLGKLTLLHGEVLSGIGNQASVYHAKRAVETYCGSVVYGHMHSPQSYTKILPHSKRDKWQSWCAPIAGATNPSYLRNRPTGWLNGFMVIELHDPDDANSNFNVYPITVSDGKFSFAGEMYGK